MSWYTTSTCYKTKSHPTMMQTTPFPRPGPTNPCSITIRSLLPPCPPLSTQISHSSFKFMASNVLLQPPFMVPRIPKTLAFSAAVARHPSAAAFISTSCYLKLNLPKLSKSCSFIVRAEANAEVEVEDSEEAKVTQFVPSEETSPRKPRIKLGDTTWAVTRVVEKLGIASTSPINRGILPASLQTGTSMMKESVSGSSFQDNAQDGKTSISLEGTLVPKNYLKTQYGRQTEVDINNFLNNPLLKEDRELQELLVVLDGWSSLTSENWAEI